MKEIAIRMWGVSNLAISKSLLEFSLSLSHFDHKLNKPSQLKKC